MCVSYCADVCGNTYKLILKPIIIRGEKYLDHTVELFYNSNNRTPNSTLYV